MSFATIGDPRITFQIDARFLHGALESWLYSIFELPLHFADRPLCLKRRYRPIRKGWFAGAMPDLNQEHPLTASYLTYSTLWYIESFGVDALRCDTYAFPILHSLRS